MQEGIVVRMLRRVLVVPAALALLGCLPVGAAAGDSCPDAQFRTGYGSRLPDCRAYEQATPVEKNGNDIEDVTPWLEASTTGDAVTFFVNGGLPGGVGSQDFPTYIARRGAGSWSTQGLLPPSSYGSRAALKGWTPDLSQSFSNAGEAGSFKFLARSSADGSFDTMANSPGLSLFYVGASTDGAHVFFQSKNHLLPEAASGEDNLYMWDRDTGALSVAGVLPDAACGSFPCVPEGGSFAGPFDWFGAEPNLEEGGAAKEYYVQDEHAISNDGDKAFFTAGGTGQIYLRKGLTGASAQTVQVSASQRGTLDPNGAKPAIFMRATPSGSNAFFTSCEKLTNDSTAVSTGENACNTENQGQDLYDYNTATGDLVDLTVDSGDPRGADVKGVLGASEDGSYVYFVANGDLDGSGPATSGDCQGYGNGFITFSGTCSLYVWHAGVTAFVARMDVERGATEGEYRSDAMNWIPNTNTETFPRVTNTSRVSRSGRTLLFRSASQLTSYDNEGFDELYLYRFGDSAPACISCDPAGAPPKGDAFVQSIPAAAFVPSQPAAVLSRNISSSGNQVFFESPDKLVPDDINGDKGCPSAGLLISIINTCNDVYEWEADGAGSCQSATDNGGCLYLLSAGVGSNPSFFADASASGDDVFIFTRDPLVPQDQDSLQDIYDVRVGGGLASQHLTPAAGCSGDVCQGVSSEASAPMSAPSSFAFSGPGNAISVSAAPVPPTVTVLHKALHGSRLSLTVRVSGPGTISVTGSGVKRLGRRVTKAGSYRLRILLTNRGKRHKRKLRVAYAPVGGKRISVALSITSKA